MADRLPVSHHGSSDLSSRGLKIMLVACVGSSYGFWKLVRAGSPTKLRRKHKTKRLFDLEVLRSGEFGESYEKRS